MAGSGGKGREAEGLLKLHIHSSFFHPSPPLKGVESLQPQVFSKLLKVLKFELWKILEVASVCIRLHKDFEKFILFCLNLHGIFIVGGYSSFYI